MKIIPLLALFLAAVILTGCNPIKDSALAEKEVPKFHALFDAEDFETIFDTGHPDFQAAQSKEDLIHFLTVVRGKVGAVKSTSKNGWQANSLNGKTNIVLTYKTVFENGDGTETFTYRVEGGKASLLGWHIDAPVILAAEKTKIQEERASEEQEQKAEQPPVE
ncbi:MAG: DUF3887 domain-containing protein [Akkermansiaceae bacterium]|nr:DUF3887 domain-containing protein [Akkermansiaceae bacterium]MDP4899025.1 DUF3887 domain-containing protein [Akkermansiaceae bacterium]